MSFQLTLFEKFGCQVVKMVYSRAAVRRFVRIY